MPGALVTSLWLAVAGLVGHHASPVCFGAAARDPQHPCSNPALRHSVRPTPDGALLQPSEPCTIVRRARPEVCAFGHSQRGASADVALIGDSHAVHWRAALAIIARRRGWHAVSIYRSQCPFGLARMHEPGCPRHTRDALHWLDKHPEVRTIFTSHNAPAWFAVDVPHRVQGFINAWRRLPPTVQRIVVIRDVPHSTLQTPGCVRHQIRVGGNVNRHCFRWREHAISPDHEVEAARRVQADPSLLPNGPRVDVIDLSNFMCDARKCFPVVGGALVIKDRGHLTRTFSRSLAPYLDRAIG